VPQEISTTSTLSRDAFFTLKSNLELDDTFDQTIQRQHNAVRSVIENNQPGTKTQLIGALQRKTRINPRPEDTFDIDILVVLGEFHRWMPVGGITPSMALTKMHQVINQSDRYGSMQPAMDHPTVSFTYEDGTKVELVPAYLDMVGVSPAGISHTPVGRGYWVPKNGHWELADYDYEAEYITQENTASNGWLIPTIKMLKAIKRKYFSDMSSFHLELIAACLIPVVISSYKARNITLSYPALINEFFNYAGGLLNSSIGAPGSNSPAISLEPLKKPQVIETFEAIKTFCNGTNQLSSETERAESWRRLFGDPFPAQ